VTRGQLNLEPIARVESALLEPGEAPLQGDEGAPDAWLVFEPGVAEGLRGLQAGAEVLVLTWLDRASREVLTVHPRGDLQRPATGVFNTRSQDRPNPIGVHRVTILAIDGNRIRVSNLEAVDRTPVLDVKPVLDRVGER
jgi:tRNA-Thr(GGU) m(6)t(6)A37 methyltransferase TsaA